MPYGSTNRAASLTGEQKCAGTKYGLESNSCEIIVMIENGPGTCVWIEARCWFLKLIKALTMKLSVR